MQKITRKQKEKEITFERREKPINFDMQKMIRFSSKQYEKVMQKISIDDEVKDFSSLVRSLLDEYLEK